MLRAIRTLQQLSRRTVPNSPLGKVLAKSLAPLVKHYAEANASAGTAPTLLSTAGTTEDPTT